MHEGSLEVRSGWVSVCRSCNDVSPACRHTGYGVICDWLAAMEKLMWRSSTLFAVCNQSGNVRTTPSKAGRLSVQKRIPWRWDCHWSVSGHAMGRGLNPVPSEWEAGY